MAITIDVNVGDTILGGRLKLNLLVKMNMECQQ